MHSKARSKHPAYPDRAEVPDSYVAWSVPYPEYRPVDFTHKVVAANQSDVKEGGWADPADVDQEELRQRTTHCGSEVTLVGGKPQNPVGRTGMVGRGLLGKHGPNHAADPIVTRINPTTRKLEMVAIERKDTKDWAIPGGMVDPGERVSVTLRREFAEEAMGNHDLSDSQRADIRDQVNNLFSKSGTELYRGYVDDPRNTDNAWMETVAVHFHCSESLGTALKLEAGDDAGKVRWLQIEDNNDELARLYASHREFVDLAVRNYYALTANPIEASYQQQESEPQPSRVSRFGGIQNTEVKQPLLATGAGKEQSAFPFVSALVVLCVVAVVVAAIVIIATLVL